MQERILCNVKDFGLLKRGGFSRNIKMYFKRVILTFCDFRIFMYYSFMSPGDRHGIDLCAFGVKFKLCALSDVMYCFV